MAMTNGNDKVTMIIIATNDQFNPPIYNTTEDKKSTSQCREDRQIVQWSEEPKEGGDKPRKRTTKINTK